MKLIIEAMSEVIIEFFGATVVLGALSLIVVLFRSFGDNFISYFLG